MGPDKLFFLFNLVKSVCFHQHLEAEADAAESARCDVMNRSNNLCKRF